MTATTQQPGTQQPNTNQASNNNMPLGKLLLMNGMITVDQLEYALKIQKNNKGKKLGDVLVDLGYVKESDLLKILASRLKVEFVEISKLKVKKEVVELLKKEYVEKNSIMPLELKDGTLTVATIDPMNFYLMDDVKLRAGHNVRSVLASQSDIQKAIALYYTDSGSEFSHVGDQYEMEEIANLDEQLKSEIENAPVVKFVNKLISVAVKTGASDIHIEPMKERTRVRMRTDGVLVEKMEIKSAAHSSLVTRIKIMSGMDISERRVPQDGRIETNQDGKSVDLRVSSIPTVYGEKIVIRVLGGIGSVLSISQLGLSAKNEEQFKKIIKSPTGMILLCGPTGSGKTTTLYSVLNEVNDKTINTITVEDPVEYKVEGITQVQVNVKAGLTFASGLRSILRQDPDVIMIGEIRDSETASIAVKSAITGHVVLSTIHTNDSVGAVARLVDMGIEPFLVASSVVGVVAQRLVKKLCPKCKHAYTSDALEMEFLGIKEPITIYKHVGCDECGGTGYKGRMAIHEVFTISTAMRELINRNATADEMKELAIKEEMITLRIDCTQHVFRGIVCMDELMRVTYEV